MMKRGAGVVKRKSDKKPGKGGKIKANKGGVKEKKKSQLKREKNKKRKNGKRRNGEKMKRKKTNTNKKKGKKRRKNKGKRRNRNKIKKRLNKMKKIKKKKGDLRQTTSAACSNLTCLTALVSVLKFEKDTVRNFLAQEKRTNSKLVLMQNKQNRSDKYHDTAVFLEKRLGDTAAHKSDGPLCKGSYNTSEGIKVKRSNWTKQKE